MLGVLRHKWAPNAFVVSFKLETDENILLQKVCIMRLLCRGIISLQAQNAFATANLEDDHA